MEVHEKSAQSCTAAKEVHAAYRRCCRGAGTAHVSERDEDRQNAMRQEPMHESYVIYGSPGSGSVPIEAALTLIGTPYEVIGETVLRDVAHNPQF
jgi:hypothetical protein